MGQVICRDCRDRDDDDGGTSSNAAKNSLFVDAAADSPRSTRTDLTANETPDSQIPSPFALDDDDDAIGLPLPEFKSCTTVATGSPLRQSLLRPGRAKRSKSAPGWDSHGTKKMKQETEFIHDCLAAAATPAAEGTEDHNNFFIFEALSERERSLLVDDMELVRYAPGQVVIQRGCKGDFFYLISEGSVAVVGSSAPPPPPDIGGARQDGRPPLARDAGADGRIGLGGEREQIYVGDDVGADSLTGEDADEDGTDDRGRWHCSSFIANDGDESMSEDVPTNRNGYSGTTANSKPALISDEIRTLGPGATFGELALLYDCTRTATCIAKTRCAIWRVDRVAFRRCMAGKGPSKTNRWNEHQEALSLLRGIDFLRSMDDVALSKVADVLTTARFEKGEYILRKGEVGNDFYIVKDGLVKIHDIGRGDSQHCDVIAGPGYWFGEMALVKRGERRVASATAVSDEVRLLVMSREEFEARLGPLQYMIDCSTRAKYLMSHPSFAGSLERHEIEALAKKVKTMFFSKGHIIATPGAKTTLAIYFVESGKIRISDEEKNTVNTLMKGDYFGAYYLKYSSSSGAYTSRARIEAVEETKCAIITRHSIEEVIGSVSRLGRPLPPVAAKLDKFIRLEDMKRHRILGLGTFGKVWLVQHKKQRSSIYALKVMDKRGIMRNKAARNVMWEKNIMASLDHPFIVDLVTTYQDQQALYMLMNFVQAGELYTLIHTTYPVGMPDMAAKFYCACILEALSYMHRRNICHRDLKPENVLIDKNGYCVVADLGFAKVVIDKTYTLCGTPEYIPPETILGRGHNRMADIWSLGVVMYELLIGQTPFIHVNATRQTLFRGIVTEDFAFPDEEDLDGGTCVTPEAQDLIRKLLNKNPTKRLGCGFEQEEEIRRHDWFADIPEGKRLRRREVRAPWVPDICDATDTHHFQTYKKVEDRELRRRKAVTVIADADQALFREF